MAAPAGLLPPRAALQTSVGVLVPLVVLVAVAGVVDGGMAALGCALATALGAPVAIARVGAITRVAFAGALVVAGVGGLLCEGRPVAAALLVAALGLAQAPFTVRAAGAAALLPVVAAITASTPLPDEPVTLGVWLAAGFAATVAILGLRGVAADAVPLAPARAWRHAGVFAVTAALATYVSLRLDVDHGYWLVLTLASVLRPVPRETRTAARDRLAGTLAGIAVAIVVVLLAPTWLALVFALACVVLVIAWALLRDTRLQTLYGTPVVILLGSSGVEGASVTLAASRLALTAAGALIATALAWMLLALESAADENHDAHDDRTPHD